MRHHRIGIITAALTLSSLGPASGHPEHPDRSRTPEQLRFGVTVDLNLEHLDISVTGRFSWGDSTPERESPTPREDSREDLRGGSPSVSETTRRLARGGVALLQVAGDTAMGLLVVAL